MNIYYLIILVIEVRGIVAFKCINKIRGIFSTNENKNLHIVSDDSYFIISKLKITRSPFYNIQYESVKFHELKSNIKNQIESFIDFDFYEESIYGIKKEPRRFKLSKLDILTDRIKVETKLQNLGNLKSFVFVDERVYAYFQHNDRIKFRSYKFYFEDYKLNLDVISQENYTNETFDKVARLSLEGNNEFSMIFTKGLNLHLDVGPLGNNSLFNYELNVNRFTNCLNVLCDLGRIDGFWFVNYNGTKRHAIILNNNYFLVHDLLNINGSTPTSQMFDSTLINQIKSTFFCELAFSIDRVNWCLRNYVFYVAKYNGKTFKLIENSSNEFNNTEEWIEFKQIPSSVIKLSNRKAILFKDHYILSSSNLTKNYSYATLFPNYDLNNLILNAYFDVITKRYLFIGSKFNFVYHQSELNDRNRFITKAIKLTQPLYGNCLRSSSHDYFRLALLFATLSSIALILLILCLTYLKYQFGQNDFQRRHRRKSFNP